MTCNRRIRHRWGLVSREEFASVLESATRGLLALNVVVLEEMEKRIGLAPLRALQSLERLGRSLVTELVRTRPRAVHGHPLSDRLAEAGSSPYHAPNNRRATMLDLTEAGRASWRTWLATAWRC